ncbi:MAG: hypothetical protein NWF03_05885 [Candidatus Bathyarchaeota archaeon]|nr:hypothetical protein [Candidatus Bathyarchaeota archaeon]
MQNKIQAVDVQLHMAVKALAVLQGEITCNLRGLIKTAEILHKKEEAGEEANHLLEMISDYLTELNELFERRKNLSAQIESLKKTEVGLIKH